MIEAVAEPLAARITGGVADPDHRHRRQSGLRRPDSGAGGHARPVAAGAEIRQALLRRSARPIEAAVTAYADEVRARAFPGAGARLSDPTKGENLMPG